MVKQRFLVLFRRWLFTMVKVFGPILLFEAFALVRQYLNYVPLSFSDLLMGTLVTFLSTALLCLAWAWGEWCWSKLRWVRLRRRASAVPTQLWRPNAAKTNKA